MSYVFADIVDVPNISPADDATAVAGNAQIVFPLIPQPDSGDWTNFWLAWIRVNGTTTYLASKSGGVGYRSFRLSLYSNPVPLVGPAIAWEANTTYTFHIEIYVSVSPYNDGQPYISDTFTFTTDVAPTVASIYPSSGSTQVGDTWSGGAIQKWTLRHTWSATSGSDLGGIRALTTSFVPEDETYSFDEVEAYDATAAYAASTLYYWAIKVRRNGWYGYSSLMTFTTDVAGGGGGGGGNKPTGGYYTVTFDGTTTGAIPYNATESEVQTIFDTAFGSGVIDVEYGAPTDVNNQNMIFRKAYTREDQVLATVDSSNLTGPGSPYVWTVEETNAAVYPANVVEPESKTDAELKTESTFTNFDFDLVWKMDTDTGYPVLRDLGGNGLDANPADIIEDLLTNKRYGAGIDSSFLNSTSFTAVQAYCNANDLLISVKIDSQKPVLDWIDYVMSHFRGYLFMSGGKINLGVFKEESAVFAITQTDLVVKEGEEPDPPVGITKRSYGETVNRLEVAWQNREADYDGAVAVAQEETDQRVSGKIRKKTMQLTGIKRETLANKMRWFFLFDSLYRYSVYTFTLAYKSMLLEVGDVGTLSDGGLITNQLIRITSIKEDKDGRGLEIEAIEDVASLYASVAGITLQQTDRVPETTAPTLVNASISFREDKTVPLIYLSIVPGSAYTNGWHIYRSFDNISYSLIGSASIESVTSGVANSIGTLQNKMVAYTAPIHRRLDKMVVSIGTITDLDTSITDSELFNQKSYLKIGDEIIGFKTCVETDTEGVWEVTDLIRGMFSTKPAAHTAGDTVYTMHPDFSYILSESEIGMTLYFKATTFYANQAQSLADVTAYSYAVQGEIQRPYPVSLLRIRDREGKSSYKTDDVTVDYNYCSKTAGFNIGGFGSVPWGNYVRDPNLKALHVLLEEEDGTDILNTRFELNEYIENPGIEILEADKDSKNPIVVTVTAENQLLSNESRSVTITKI